MVDILCDLRAVGAIGGFTAFDAMKVFVEWNVTCAELGQDTGLSAVRISLPSLGVQASGTRTCLSKSGLCFCKNACLPLFGCLVRIVRVLDHRDFVTKGGG